MRKYPVTTTLLSLILLVSASFAGDSDKGQQTLKSSLPRANYHGQMQLSEDFFDFGYMPGDSKVSHIFWLKNVGTDTLEIKRIQPGCGCTKAPLRKRLIAVNDSAKIEIIFSSGRFRGEVSKTPRIFTSDQRVKDKGLRFKAYVIHDDDSIAQHPLEIEPFGINAVIGQEKEEYPVFVKNVSDQTLEISLVSSDPEVMDVALPDKVKPGDKARISLKLKNLEDYQIPGFGKSFTIQLSDDENTRYTIPVLYEKAKDASRGD
ncbi:MAG TPA: DUF1573 domain-containing protein [candidate division Zixibacteria bacterium]|nr:DUF1573 domain-containing protein [candidate division Zixibacteria bacterium]